MRPRPTRHSLRAGSLALVAFLVGFTVHALHFDLDRSVPEAGSSLSSPGAIQLWFTQVPQENSTSIRLMDHEGNAIETSDVTQDAKDGKLQYVSLSGPLIPGAYTVAWRSMAADGHVVRDDFAFNVVAAGATEPPW